MVAAMGSIFATDRGARSRPPHDRSRPSDSNLFRDGAMAVLDYDRFNGPGDLPALPARDYSASQRHLATLLRPLHDDPDDLARRLLDRFGSIGAITDADEAELRQCVLYGEQWIDSFLGMRQLYLDGLRERVIRTRLNSEDRDLRTYLFSSLRSLKAERLVAIFADEAGYVIREEVIADGATTHIVLSPRHIFQRALALNSRRILLAHNHPSGSSTPSKTDIEQTRKLAAQAQGLGIAIDDHMVIGLHSISSLRELGFL